MILEGIPTILLGISAYFILADEPASARSLTAREKELTRIRHDQDKMTLPEDEGGQLQWSQVLEAFKNWKVWTLSTAQIGVTVMLYGYSTFLPTIIEALGYSGIHTQLLTIPRYA